METTITNDEQVSFVYVVAIRHGSLDNTTGKDTGVN